MHNNLGKKIFKLTYDLLRFIQICLIFLSLFVIAYWFLSIAGTPIIQPVAPFFEGIKNLVHLFYNRPVAIDKAVLDFSLIVAAIIFLLFVLGIKFVIEFIEIAEEKYDVVYKTYKKHTEKVFNAQLEKEYLEQEARNNKTIALVKFKASGASSDADTEGKVKEILFDFFEILDEDIDCKKEITENTIFLYFNDYNNIDRFVTSLETILKGIKAKYYEDKWQVNYNIGIDVYAEAQEIEAKKDSLKKLVKIGLDNKIACLATFKHRYLMTKVTKYTFVEEGYYNIIKNDEVFSLKPLK